MGSSKGFAASLLKMLITSSILSVPGNYINMSARQILAGGYRDPLEVFRGINTCFLDVSSANESL